MVLIQWVEAFEEVSLLALETRTLLQSLYFRICGTESGNPGGDQGNNRHGTGMVVWLSLCFVSSAR